METEEKKEVLTEQMVRTSKDNMLCLVPYEELPGNEQAEIEKILQVANG